MSTKKMTEEEKAISFETLKHIINVRNLLDVAIHIITLRAKNHDTSKLEDPELVTFVKYTPKLAETTYGSDEYKQYLREMGPALEHHYAINRHHPECFQELDSMNLFDVLEMLCDWMAVTKRHDDGDIMKSIEIN